jgi:hypothetical protein
MNPPTLSVKSIRNILLKEYEEHKDTLYSRLFVDSHLRDYFGDAILNVKGEIESLETYEDLDKFIGDHYRMSLEDWVNSL